MEMKNATIPACNELIQVRTKECEKPVKNIEAAGTAAIVNGDPLLPLYEPMQGIFTPNTGADVWAAIRMQ